MHYILGFFLLCFAVTPIQAQQVSFRADCNAEDVVVGNPFRVSFQLENADIRNINFPDFERAGFNVMQGPINETRYSNINGQRSFVEAYSFILTATRTGELILGSARVVTSKGKALSSKPITVNSVKANTAGVNDDENTHNLPAAIAGKVIFRMEPSTKNAVVGEPILLNFKIYTQIDLSSIELTGEPDLNHLYVHPMRYFDQDAKVEVLNGRQYATKIIYSVNCFASKPGTLEIDPATVAIAIGRASANNAFARPQVYPLKSNRVKIEVKGLDKTPKTFTGAVGKYKMEAFIEKSNITTDDALKVKIMVSGIGDIKQALAPPILFGEKADEPFEIFPPKIKEELRENASGLGGIKEFDYVLNPQALGDFEIRPTFTYYDTKAGKFITLDTVFNVRVIQGTRKLSKIASAAEVAAAEKEEKEAAISFAASSTTALWHAKTQPFFGSLLFWIVTLLPLLVFGGLAGSRFYFEKQALLAAKKREKTKAEREVNEGLQQAGQLLKANDSAAFYQTISESFKTYLGTKLSIPKAEINKELIAQRLEAIEADEQRVRQLLRVLKICEVSVFAAQNNNQAMERIYNDSKELVDFFNKTLG